MNTHQWWWVVVIFLPIIITHGLRLRPPNHNNNVKSKLQYVSSSSSKGTIHQSPPPGEGEEDLCEGLWCGQGEECHMTPSGLPECKCLQKCPEPSEHPPPSTSNNNGAIPSNKDESDWSDEPSEEEYSEESNTSPICGSDGITYPSKCELYRRACVTNSVLFLDYSGKGCGQPPDHVRPPPQEEGDQDSGQEGGGGGGGQYPNNGPSSPDDESSNYPPRPHAKGQPDQEGVAGGKYPSDDGDDDREFKNTGQGQPLDKPGAQKPYGNKEEESLDDNWEEEEDEDDADDNRRQRPMSVSVHVSLSKPQVKSSTDDDKKEASVEERERPTWNSQLFHPKESNSNGNDGSSSGGSSKIKRGSSLCSPEEYQIFKEAVLSYNRNLNLPNKDSDDGMDMNELFHIEHNHKLTKQYLLSKMFAKFDLNHDGALDYAEIQKIGMDEKLGAVTLHCHSLHFLRFDDTDHDQRISTQEFYSLFTNHKHEVKKAKDKRSKRMIKHVKGNVGSTLRLICDPKRRPSDGDDDDSSSSSGYADGDDGPSDRGRIIWFRYGIPLSTTNNSDDRIWQRNNIPVVQGNTLIFKSLKPLHAANYSCHVQRMTNRVHQHALYYHLSVFVEPEVRVRPSGVVWKEPGSEVEFKCRVRGEPPPNVTWLKNEVALPISTEDSDGGMNEWNRKYRMGGDGISLKIRDVQFSDTGAYMCQAENEAASRMDIASLVVIDDDAIPNVELNETQFLVFHERGISAYNPTNCRLQHEILSTNIIPGTRMNYICGPSKLCEWGSAIKISSVYIYASQPQLDRILVISISQMVVVDVINTDPYPLHLNYLAQVDQVWVQCLNPGHSSSHSSLLIKSIQVIKNAKEKHKHRALHPKKPFDPSSLVDKPIEKVFVPRDVPSASQFTHGYISRPGTQILLKVDLETFKILKNIDLTPYDCHTQQMLFSSLYGFVIVQCEKSPTTGESYPHQLILDALTDEVITTFMGTFHANSFLSPDSRHLVTLVQDDVLNKSTLNVQFITENGLERKFTVGTEMNISDLTFFPSTDCHFYDLYATSLDTQNILFVNLQTRATELVGGVGRPPEPRLWNKPFRPIVSQDIFAKYVVSPSKEALFVLNGHSHTVNCEVGGIRTSQIIIWL